MKITFVSSLLLIVSCCSDAVTEGELDLAVPQSSFAYTCTCGVRMCYLKHSNVKFLFKKLQKTQQLKMGTSRQRWH